MVPKHGRSHREIELGERAPSHCGTLVIKVQIEPAEMVKGKGRVCGRHRRRQRFERGELSRTDRTRNRGGAGSELFPPWLAAELATQRERAERFAPPPRSNSASAASGTGTAGFRRAPCSYLWNRNASNLNSASSCVDNGRDLASAYVSRGERTPGTHASRRRSTRFGSHTGLTDDMPRRAGFSVADVPSAHQVPHRGHDRCERAQQVKQWG